MGQVSARTCPEERLGWTGVIKIAREMRVSYWKINEVVCDGLGGSRICYLEFIMFKDIANYVGVWNKICNERREEVSRFSIE